MKHLLLDVNVVLDLWFNRSKGVVEALMRHSAAKRWVSASSLPILEYIACLELKKAGADGREAKIVAKNLLSDLLKDVNVLSNFSYHVTEDVVMSTDLEDAQIAMAGSELQADAIVVSNDKSFDTLGAMPVKMPKEALEWLRCKTSDKQEIDFIDLKTQQDLLRPQLEKNIHSVLQHGQYIMGSEVGLLEEKLAEYIGVKHAVGVASGTDALLIAMMALGVGHGDEVITTPFTFIATAEAIALLGAKPIFVDIDPKTYNIDPNLIEAAITERTKVIMPVSLYGQCADYDAINAIAAKHDIPVIEDGCQSFGATYKGKKSCGLTTIGCTSFFPSKPLGGYGDGGACFTNDDELAKAMREIRVHGQDKQYHHALLGINGRLDSLQAAILLAKMDVFSEEVESRRKIGERYSVLLSGCSLTTPYITESCQSVYAQYTIQVSNREHLQSVLKDKGIPTAVHYPIPLHLQPIFECLDQVKGSFPVAESISERVMSLPMHPYLDDTDMDVIVDAVRNSCDG